MNEKFGTEISWERIIRTLTKREFNKPKVSTTDKIIQKKDYLNLKAGFLNMTKKWTNTFGGILSEKRERYRKYI
jgi:hypothetical protein